MNKKFTKLMAALALLTFFAVPLGMRGQTTVTYKQTSTNAVSVLSGTAPGGSTASFSTTYTDKNQLTAGNSMTLTLSGYKGYKITGITLSMKSNSSKGAGSLSVVAGTTTIASIADSKFNTENWYGQWSTSYVDINVTMSNSSYEIQENEDVVITIAASENSLYCQSFTLTYEAVSGGGMRTDMLDRNFTGVTGSSYSSWNNKTGTSGAVYAGNSAGGNSSIQLRSSDNSGIISTTSAGIVTHVTVVWNSNTSNNRTLNVYGKNSEYEATSDLYDNTKQGTLLGTIVKGSSTELTIDGDYAYIGLRSNSGAMYLTSVSITWEEAPDVATPSFSPDGGTYGTAQSVTISCTTEGATIRYTLDGSDPTSTSQVYSDPLTISSNTTLKAIAFVGDEASNVASATYTFLAPLTSMQEIFDAATSTSTQVAITFDNFVVTGKNSGSSSNKAYLTDGTKGCIIYESSHGFTAGDVLNGTAVCNLVLFGNAAELTGLKHGTSGLTVTTGGSVTPIVTTVDMLSAVNTGSVVTLNGLKYDGTTTLKDSNNNAVVLSNTIYSASLTSGKTYNITGVFEVNYSNKRINPRSVVDIVEVVDPEILISGNEIENNTVELAYNDETVYSATVTYNSMDEPDAGEVAIGLYNDINCETPFTGNWFDAGFETNSVTSIEYYATANTTNSPRTVYMRVETFNTMGTDWVPCNVITITQAEAPLQALYSYSINGVEGETFEGFVGGEISLANGANLNDDFVFAGWTTDPSDVNTQLTGNYTLTEEVTTFYAVYAQTVTSVGEAVIILDGSSLSSSQSGVEATFTENNISYKYKGAKNTDVPGTAANYFKKTKAILMPKTYMQQSGYLYNTTAFGQGITKFEVYANKNASTSAEVAINFSTTPIESFDASASNTWTQLLSTTDAVYEATIPTGAKFFWFQTTSTSNSQVQFRITYNGTNNTTTYYTRVFLNETVTDDIEIVGPSIIPNGQILDMGENFLLNVDPANLIIEDGAQLYTEDVVEATIKKNISAYDPSLVGQGVSNGWYFISYPLNTYGTNGDVPTSVTNMISSSAQSYDLYLFDGTGEGYGQEIGKEWVNYKGQGHTQDFFLCNGHGYLYANANDVTLEFAGSLNFRDPDNDFVSLDNTGWNLVGNPFAYNTYPSLPYYKMNDAGTGIEANESTTADAVAPCTGILVNSDAGSITFSKNAPSGAKGSINLALAKNERGAAQMDNAILSFNEGSQLGKFYFGTQNANLYIPQGIEEYAIVNTEAQGEMPVNFRANEDGQYTLTVNPENVDMNYLHLIDNMTGMDVDLLQTPSYTFSAATRDYESRFKLVFAANSIDEADESSFAFFSNGNLIVNNEGNATLQVIDINGRILSSETISGSCSKAINATTGVYMLRLINGENVKIQKVVVR